MNYHVVPRRIYFAVYALLLALLFLTVALGEVDLGIWNPIAAVSIAVAKALLIVLYFMHLHYEGGLLRLFAAAGFVWLALLMAIVMSDYLTRASSFALH